MISEKMPSTSRRSLIKWGIYGIGGIAIGAMPQAISAQSNIAGKMLTFNANDIGILNFALLLEELESVFYAAVVSSGKVTNSRELEYIRYLGAQESSHVKFLRDVLGNQALFETKDLSFNAYSLNDILGNRDRILNAAVTLEDLGVHAYNGAGMSMTNPTFLLAAGSIVSVEARHSAGIRALLNKPTTEPDRDRLINNANLNPTLNLFKGKAYDELYTPKQIVAILSSLKVLNNPIGGTLVS
ncbi:ferritin-like domain-containing protein [Pseudanabaena sp. FACHB-1998]|uniref:ferritin-like domain-containing protein n=1 Tax=Pseudanabaena sp. FACHB-1998 TaxID=2692858 RepID=UPI001680D761|nr:ferritin-like domain-containing protein [Pseudanabaena sp. FACHB-1998]MBD2178631.1 ferritin-like domain-containing protein [Pseudanabaena sp. FACHB-1998]